MSPFTPDQEARIREIVREELQAAEARLRAHTKRTAAILERWDGDGLEAYSRPPTDGHEPQAATAPAGATVGEALGADLLIYELLALRLELRELRIDGLQARGVQPPSSVDDHLYRPAGGGLPKWVNGAIRPGPGVSLADPARAQPTTVHEIGFTPLASGRPRKVKKVREPTPPSVEQERR